MFFIIKFILIVILT